MLFKPAERQSLAMLTDLYQLTMACASWKTGRSQTEGAFHMAFRRHPFGGGYTICCGLAPLAEFIQDLRFEDDDLVYLAGLRGQDGKPLFPDVFLAFLGAMEFACDIDAVPEGTVVFPYEPLVRVEGPTIQCQLLETALLNIINFQTLIATKAARICSAAEGDVVLEFGLRRAQGIDGAFSAARAAFAGGCAATSNVLAGKLLGIPVRGTHAHSWVMSFDSELEAFKAYAAAMPGNCTLLVDTYDTLQGVRNAIEAGKSLREAGGQLAGVRLDSGDLAGLSIEARQMLDDAGFPETRIVATNDLDERQIETLRSAGAKIDIWGVGTRLVTAHEEPALGGVFKLGATRDSHDAPWQLRMKLSEQPEKASIPGRLQVRRYAGTDGLMQADVIFEEGVPPSLPCRVHDPLIAERCTAVHSAASQEDLLQPVFRRGKFVGQDPPLAEIQRRCRSQVASLRPGIRRLSNPEEYSAGLAEELHQKRLAMISEWATIKTE